MWLLQNNEVNLFLTVHSRLLLSTGERSDTLDPPKLFSLEWIVRKCLPVVCELNRGGERN